MATVQQQTSTTTEVRRVQRASKTGSLIVSIPHKFIEKIGLQKGSHVSFEMLSIKNNTFLVLKRLAEVS
jgi:antitoxin component of MazEF toxin-antitoxin module